MIKKLLAIRLSALGDICMTLPVIDSFCRAYPDVELTLLTSKPGAAITKAVLHLPNLQIVAINKKDYSGLMGANRLYKEMRAYHFDAIADLHDVLRTKWTALRFRIAGYPVAVIDKGRGEKKKLVSHKIEAQLTSGIERYKKVFTDPVFYKCIKNTIIFFVEFILVFLVIHLNNSYRNQCLCELVNNTVKFC